MLSQMHVHHACEGRCFRTGRLQEVIGCSKLSYHACSVRRCWWCTSARVARAPAWAFKGPHAACGARTGGSLQQTLWPRKAGFQSMGWCGFNWTLIYARRSLELALLDLTGCTWFLWSAQGHRAKSHRDQHLKSAMWRWSLG